MARPFVNIQGRNFGLKSGGTSSGGENMVPLGTETRSELSGGV